MHRIQKVFSTYLFLPILVVIAVALTSCSQYQSQQSAPVFSAELDQTATQYLTQAQQTTGINQIDWLLLAANASLKEKNSTQTAAILQQLANQPLNNAQQQEFNLTQGMLAYFQQDAKLAQQAFSKLDLKSLSGVQRYHYYLIQVYLSSGDPLQQLTAYVQLEKAAESVAEQHQIIDETWQVLSKITPEQMSKFVIDADAITLQGWLDLWQVKQHNQNSFTQLQNAIAAWQARYPYNPAATYLPRTIFAPYYTLPTDNSSLKIALLLPLSGEYQPLGQAILRGFEQAMITGHVAQQNTATLSSPTTSDDNSTPNSQTTATVADTEEPQLLDKLWLKQEIAQHLKIYDTNSVSISSLVSQAEQSGAQLIVGPFLSKNVAAIAAVSSSLPILALNSPSKVTQTTDNMCYFSISPTEEAREAAQYIQQQGKALPLVLAPNNTLGHAIANAFASAWKKSGGGDVLGQFFPNKTDLAQLMNKGVGISIDGDSLLADTTTATNSTANSVSSKQSASLQSHSNSVDAIYLVASKDQLLLLKPMLEMLTPQERTQPEMALKKLPQIYMSSFGREQDEGTDFNLEMNNIIFSDMPMLSEAQQQLLQKLPDDIKDDYSLVRAYAMGEDAWRLAQNYPQLRSNPNYQLQGETGTLEVGANCIIQREPVWQQYRNGEIVTLP